MQVPDTALDFFSLRQDRPRAAKCQSVKSGRQSTNAAISQQQQQQQQQQRVPLLAPVVRRPTSPFWQFGCAGPPIGSPFTHFFSLVFSFVF